MHVIWVLLTVIWGASLAVIVAAGVVAWGSPRFRAFLFWPAPIEPSSGGYGAGGAASAALAEPALVEADCTDAGTRAPDLALVATPIIDPCVPNTSKVAAAPEPVLAQQL